MGIFFELMLPVAVGVVVVLCLISLMSLRRPPLYYSISDIDGLDTELKLLRMEIDTKAPIRHRHISKDIYGLPIIIVKSQSEEEWNET